MQHDLKLYETYKIDINWILTGEREDALHDDEQSQLLEYFKRCDNEAKEDIIRFVRRCALTQPENMKK